MKVRFMMELAVVGDAGDIDERIGGIATALDDDGSEPAVSVSLGRGRVQIGVTVEAETELDALVEGASRIRSALYTTAGPGVNWTWVRSEQRVISLVPLDDGRGLPRSAS